MITASVESRSLFAAHRAHVQQVARESADVGATAGGAVARNIASTRSKTGRMASIQLEHAHRRADGWEAAFVSPARYAFQQNFGTLGRREKHLKGPRSSRDTGPQSGVRPLYFLNAGRREGQKAMLAYIRVRL